MWGWVAENRYWCLPGVSWASLELGTPEPKTGFLYRSRNLPDQNHAFLRGSPDPKDKNLHFYGCAVAAGWTGLGWVGLAFADKNLDTFWEPSVIHGLGWAARAGKVSLPPDTFINRF